MAKMVSYKKGGLNENDICVRTKKSLMCFCKQFLENTSFIIQSPSEAVFGDLSPCPNITRRMQNRRSYSWNFYFITWAHHLKDLLLFHFAPIHIWCMWTNTATSLTLVDSRGLNEWMPAGPGGWMQLQEGFRLSVLGDVFLLFWLKKKKFWWLGFQVVFTWKHESIIGLCNICMRKWLFSFASNLSLMTLG